MSVNYEALLYAAFFTPMGDHPTEIDEEDWGARLLMWGPPGGGKTSAWKRLARQMQANFLAIDSTVGEGALGVCPTPDMEAKVLRFMPADFIVERFPKGEAGILLCDDATTFAPALQQPLLGLLLNKRIGFHHFGPRVRVAMAANEPIDAPGGWDLAPAVANRPCHIEWPDPTVDAWCTWLLSGANGGTPRIPVDALAEEARVLKEWPEAWAKAAGLMAGWSQARPNLHRVQPDVNDPQASKAWTSPRTKEFATRALASSFVHALHHETADVFVGGYVGQSFADEFSTWRLDQDLPSARGFLEGKEHFSHDPHRIDRTTALLSSCVALFSQINGSDRKALVPTFYKFLDTVAEDAIDTVADVVVSSLHNLKLVRGVPEAKAILKRLRPVLEACEETK